MIRGLYRCVLRLHPPAFRLQFAGEMLWIFDEAADAWGAASLFCDASVSLLRQWLMRSDLWRWIGAGIAGVVPAILLFGDWNPLPPCSYAQNWKWVVAGIAGLVPPILAFGSPVARAKLKEWVSCLGALCRLNAVRHFRR